jgi:hypothetical protein
VTDRGIEAHEDDLSAIHASTSRASPRREPR